MIKNLPLVLLFALAGCATDSSMHRPEVFPIAGRMEAELRLTQHQIFVSHTNSVAGSAAGMQAAASPSVAAGGFAAGAAAGLIGALVDAAIDAHRNSVAEDAAKPMREHMQGLDVDDLIGRSADCLDKHLFAETIAVQRLSTSEGDDTQQRKLKAGANVLVLAPSYSVSYDGKTFTYLLAVRIVDRAMNSNGLVVSTPRYHQVFEYILAQDALPGGAQWGTLSAEQWQSILADAANETVAMLNYDIAAHPGEARLNMAYDRLAVSVDQTKGDRSWVRTRFGALLSVPSTSLKPNGRS